MFYPQFTLILGESGISPRVPPKITLYQLHSERPSIPSLRSYAKKSLLLSHALWRYIRLFSEQSKFCTKSNSPSHSFNSVFLKHLHHYIFQLDFTTILRQLVEFSESSKSSFQYLDRSNHHNHNHNHRDITLGVKPLQHLYSK